VVEGDDDAAFDWRQLDSELIAAAGGDTISQSLMQQAGIAELSTPSCVLA
jgi:hypothetical protein